MNNYPRIFELVTAAPWAILPYKLAVIRSLLALRFGGQRLAEDDIRAAIEGAAPRGARADSVGGVAVLPVVGTIIPRADLLTESSGGVSIERLRSQFQAALNDPAVGSIVLDIDSPGGQVSGVPELATDIFGARGQKPIVAVANHLAASAAYWLASAADELVVTPSGEVGSIGVFAMHEDISAAMDKFGIKTTLISSGKYKVEGNPFEPLSAEARAAIQARVDEYYQMFTTAVAKQRGVSRRDVVNGFGEGRTVGSREAVALGMADRIGTLADTVQRLAGGNRRRRSAAADIDFRRRRLRLAEKPGSVETGALPDGSGFIK